MREQMILSMPSPCNQDWNKMTPAEKGRHCSSCNKIVTDFSNYTDKELVAFFKQNKKGICGNFNIYQLNRPIEVMEPSRHSIFYKLLFGTAMASWLGITSTASAQNNNSKAPVEQQDSSSHAKSANKAKLTTEDTNTITIKSQAQTDSFSHLNLRGDCNATEYIVDGIKVTQSASNDTDVYTLPDVSTIHIPAKYEGKQTETYSRPNQ